MQPKYLATFRILAVASFLLLGLPLVLSACGDSPTAGPIATVAPGIAPTNAPTATIVETATVPVATKTTANITPGFSFTSLSNATQVALPAEMQALLVNGFKGVTEDIYVSTDNADTFAKAVNDVLTKSGYKFRGEREKLEASAPGMYLVDYVSSTTGAPDVSITVLDISKLAGFLTNFKADQAKILQDAANGQKSYMRFSYGVGLHAQLYGSSTGTPVVTVSPTTTGSVSSDGGTVISAGAFVTGLEG